MSVTPIRKGELLGFDPSLPGSFEEAMKTLGRHVDATIHNQLVNPSGDRPDWSTFKVEVLETENPLAMRVRVSLTMMHQETDTEAIKALAVSSLEAKR